MYALLFVMFDVEAVFVFPWAVRPRASAMLGLVEMTIFIVILALGLVYAWRQGGAPVGLVEKGTLSKPALKPSPWLLNYSRKYSLWMFQWGLACCAIEMGAALASLRHDVMRLGSSHRPARFVDLICISGTVTDKMAPAVKRLYEQMPDPKYVISMGSGQLRRPLLGLVLGDQGRRPGDPRRRLRRAGLLAARSPAAGHRAVAGALHPERGHRQRRARASLAGSRSSLSDVTGTDVPGEESAAAAGTAEVETEEVEAEEVETAEVEAPGLRRSHAHADLMARLEAAFLGDAVLESAANFGLPVVRVRRHSWRHAAEICKTQLDLDYLSFLAGLDWMPAPREGGRRGGW